MKINFLLFLIISTLIQTSSLVSAGKFNLIEIVPTLTLPQNINKELQVFNKMPKTSRSKWEKSNATGRHLYKKLINNNSAEIKTGDIILRLNGDDNALGIAITSLGGFSHAGILLREDKKIYVVDVHPGNDSKKRKTVIGKTLLKYWISDNTLQVMILRPHDSGYEKKIKKLLHLYLSYDIRFDWKFDLDNDKIVYNDDKISTQYNFYCSEFVYTIVKKVHQFNDNSFLNSKPIGIDIATKLQKRLKSDCRDMEEDKCHFSKLLEMLDNYINKSEKISGKLISPASFEWSVEYDRIMYEYSDKINDYKELLSLYIRTHKKILALRSLNNKKKNSLDFNEIKSFFIKKLNINENEIYELETPIKKSLKRSYSVFNSNLLILDLVTWYSDQNTTTDLIYTGLKNINRFK